MTQQSIALGKLGVQLIAGLGVGRIVSNIVKNNVPVLTTMDKVLVNTGSFVLGSLLIEQANDHVERTVNSATKFLENKNIITPEKEVGV